MDIQKRTLHTLLFTLILFLPTSKSLALKFDVNAQKITLETIEEYRGCHSQYRESLCEKSLKNWVRSHPSDAFKAGKLVRSVMNHYVSTPYFLQAIKAGQGSCADKDLALATFSALARPSKKNPYIKTGLTLAFEHCFLELKGQMKQQMLDSNAFFVNTCQRMKTKKMLSKRRIKMCDKRTK